MGIVRASHYSCNNAARRRGALPLVGVNYSSLRNTRGGSEDGAAIDAPGVWKSRFGTDTEREAGVIRTVNSKWDAFISHASEDKDDFVRPLADGLTECGLSVWFDEFELKVGDRLRESIDRGLSQSRFGIVVLSPHFFEKKWPQEELSGLVTRETGGAKVILPVWHNLDAEAVRTFSPILADRVAIPSSKGLNRVIADLMQAIAPPAEAPQARPTRGTTSRRPTQDQRELLDTPASKSGAVPVEALKQSPVRTVITVRSAAGSLPGADLLILFPNKTWKLATTDAHGKATVDSHATHLPMTVFAAAKGYAAHVEREWMPSQRSLAIELEPLPAGGAVIFPEATGHVPGVTGRLNPKRDTHDRTYLYASNIAINEGKQQPVRFDTGEEMRLTDAEGRERLVRIVEVIGQSALVEYQPVRAT